MLHGKNTPPVFTSSDDCRKLVSQQSECSVFRAFASAGALFVGKDVVIMEKNYFVDTLFDLINESDELEAELEDVCVSGDGLKVSMKDGTSFQITVSKEA